MAKTTPKPLPIGLTASALVPHFVGSGKPLDAHLDEAFGAMVAAGVNCYEPVLPADEAGLGPVTAAAQLAGLAIASSSASVSLHDAETWRDHADKLIARAKAARSAWAAKLLTVTLDPVSESSSEPKTDAQLRTQTGALRYLVDALAGTGITLVYRPHPASFGASAREFHHMMLATADKPMRWCLDTHAIYLGTGQSNIALEDVVKLYGPRVSTFRLGQCVNAAPEAAFTDGDISHLPWVSVAKSGRLPPAAGQIFLSPPPAASGQVTPTTLPLADHLAADIAKIRQLLGA